MEQEKGMFKSMGIWGGVLSLLPALDALHAYLEASQSFLPEPVQFVTIGIGAVLSIFGRLRADSKIKGLL
jgi:hypothetical protein